MLKVVKLVSFLFWIIILMVLATQQFSESSLVQTIFYLWMLVGWVIFIAVYKKKSKFSIFTALSLFVISGILTSFNLTKISEILMRISFILWIIILAQSVVEFKRASK